MKTEIIKADHPISLKHAEDILRHGGLVAFPTDTVYGLASLPFDKSSIDRLFSAKGRNSNRAIAILIGEIKDLEAITPGMGDIGQRLADCFWPGPLTLVVPRNPALPAVISPTDTIGVRMPDHPVALALLRSIGPLAVTSANISGYENSNTAQEVMEQLNGRIHLIIDGGMTEGGIPSTVVDCTAPDLVVLRPGPISMDDIQRELARTKFL
jgi:L-threonylcarbamoyladenylate synthase